MQESEVGKCDEESLEKVAGDERFFLRGRVGLPDMAGLDTIPEHGRCRGRSRDR